MFFAILCLSLSLFIKLSVSHFHEDDPSVRCGHDLEGGNNLAKYNQIDVELKSDSYRSSSTFDNLSPQAIEDITSTWNNMRISLNYAGLDSNTILTTAEKEVVKKAMTGSINFLSRILRVDNIDNGLNLLCNNNRLTCTNCDLILRVIAADCSYKASASACAVESTTGRPIAGTVTWCYNAIRSSIWNRDVEIAIHEIIHVLGFSAGSFDDWLDAPYGNRRGNNAAKYLPYYVGNKYSLVTSNVVSTMKEHFNCSSLEGAPLEENGGSGSASSHWDYRMFLGDLMCAKSNDAVDVFSKMTAAALEDTNWYRVNWNYVHDWRYAQNEGCNFLTGSCLNTNNGESLYPEYFCDTINSHGCWWDRTVAHAPCVLSTSNTCPYAYPNDMCGYEWADYCPINRIADTYQTSQDTCLTGYYEADVTISGSLYGINSRCAVSTINNKGVTGGVTTENGRCYKMECLNYDIINKQYNNIRVYIGSNNDNIICSRDESNNFMRKTINNNNYYGEIECPPIDIICGSSTKSFECLNGNWNDELNTCICHAGWTGTICNQYDDSTASSITPTPTTPAPTTPPPTIRPICCLSRINGRCNGYTTRDTCEKNYSSRKQCYWDTSNPQCI